MREIRYAFGIKCTTEIAVVTEEECKRTESSAIRSWLISKKKNWKESDSGDEDYPDLPQMSPARRPEYKQTKEDSTLRVM